MINSLERVTAFNSNLLLSNEEVLKPASMLISASHNESRTLLGFKLKGLCIPDHSRLLLQTGNLVTFCWTTL